MAVLARERGVTLLEDRRTSVGSLTIELYRAAVLLAVLVLFGTTAWWLFQAVVLGGGSWGRLGIAVLACAGVLWLMRDDAVVAPAESASESLPDNDDDGTRTP